MFQESFVFSVRTRPSTCLLSAVTGWWVGIKARAIYMRLNIPSIDGIQLCYFDCFTGISFSSLCSSEVSFNVSYNEMGGMLRLKKRFRRTWWRHEMETFSALLALCEGNPPVTGGFPSQRPITQRFDFSLICARTNGWANNRDDWMWLETPSRSLCRHCNEIITCTYNCSFRRDHYLKCVFSGS